jgi:O-antigen ligase
MKGLAAILLATAYLILGSYAVPSMRIEIFGIDLPYTVPILLCSASVYMLEKGPVALFRNIPIILGCVLYLAATTLAVALNQISGSTELFKAFVFPLSLFLVTMVCESTRSATSITTALALTGIAVFGYGVYGYLTWNVGDYLEHTYNYFGVTYKPSTRNGDQLYFLIAAAVLIGFQLTPSRKKLTVLLKVLSILILGAIYLGVALSYSRGAWVTLAALSLVGLFLADRAQKAAVVRAGLAFAGLFLVIVAGFSLFRSVQENSSVGDILAARFESIYTLDNVEGSNSNQLRILLLKQSMELIAANPLGIGVGAAGGILVVDGSSYGNHAENSYIQVALERGLLGLIGFGYLMIYALRRTFINARMPGAPFAARSGFLTAFTLVLYACFNNLIDSAWFWMSFACALGSLCAARSDEMVLRPNMKVQHANPMSRQT